MLKRILIYGDSNTHGHDPTNILHLRYDENQRYPKLLQKLLGNDYEIIEEGLNSRAISNACDYEYLNGLKQLPMTLLTNNPLDLIIIMLGTNDLKLTYNRQVEDMVNDLQEYIAIIKEHTTLKSYRHRSSQIMFISPVSLHPTLKDSIYASEFYSQENFNKLKEFNKQLEIMCIKNNVHFLDAYSSIQAGYTDKIHLEEEQHHQLSQLIYNKIQTIKL
ncbi:MAG: GDSL-type esterase/lipase family protein [Erysipelotrichaceae bacterium]